MLIPIENDGPIESVEWVYPPAGTKVEVELARYVSRVYQLPNNRLLVLWAEGPVYFEERPGAVTLLRSPDDHAVVGCEFDQLPPLSSP